jgi:hypothetical protein
MDQGVWHDEDFQVRMKLEKPKLKQQKLLR